MVPNTCERNISSEYLPCMALRNVMYSVLCELRPVKGVRKLYHLCETVALI